MAVPLVFVAPVQLGAKRSRHLETSQGPSQTMQAFLWLAALSPGLPGEWSELVDEIQQFPFEEPGCEHFPLLVYVSCVLIALQGNKLTITTDSIIQPVISCDCCSTSTTAATCYKIAISSWVKGRLIIDALSGIGVPRRW